MSLIHVIIMCKSETILPFIRDDFQITIYKEQEYVNKTTLTQDEYNENCNYINALKIAKQDDRPCLIIKQASVCHLISCELYNRLVTILKINTDLCFLCTWQDECYKYRDHNDYLKWSEGSSATQAILYKTNRGKSCVYNDLKLNKFHLSHLLKNCIVKKEIKALVCIPNLIQYDINQVLSNTDYTKLNCCLPVPVQKEPTSNTNNAAWIFIIVLFIILLVVLVPYFKHSKKL